MRSAQFDDIYFSVDDGLAESRYVFLDANHLKARFSEAEQLTLLELGFGTGLNFLATWQYWQQYAPKTAKLTYYSIEKYPLPSESIQTLVDHWPELHPLLKQWLPQYPKTLKTGQCYSTTISPNLTLKLIIGDAHDALQTLPTPFDVIYLDGFAPSKNPDMWSATLMQQLARLSRPKTCLSTFTAAGIVKRNLIAAGFDVEKIPGFGRKRHMLRAFR